MILINQSLDLDLDMFNPSITMMEKSISNKHYFPDTSSYFILSDVSENYKVISNSTILINNSKWYYEHPFYVNEITNTILSISNEFFSKTKPIDGLARKALELAILKNGKKHPTLKNRL